MTHRLANEKEGGGVGLGQEATEHSTGDGRKSGFSWVSKGK